MELCTTRAISTPSLNPNRFFTTASCFRFNPSSFLRKRTQFLGASCRTSTLLRAISDETSNEAGKFTDERTDTVATLEDVPSVDNGVTLDNVPPVVNRSAFDGTPQPETPQEEESPSDESMQPLNELLDKLNIKLDSEDSYTIFLYGGGALVAVYLLSAIVGAIDSIPVFPKLMEIVGLGFSLWFTTRYLLFKRNREELLSRIDELKREVLGSSDD